MTITAAADGSALGNPGPNGWAWFIDERNWAAGGSAHGTNNQGELRAVLELLRATAHTDEPLVIECDSRYVIDSVTKWMPGWKRRGWRKSDGGAVLNRDLMEQLDEALSGREVTFEWVKGHAGHALNEAADERANAAAKAYQEKREPDRGPGFAADGSTSTDVTPAEPGTPTALTSAPTAAPAASPTEPAPPALWAEASSLLDVLDDTAANPIELRMTLSGDEHARLRDRADAQEISLEQALRRLI